MPVGVQVAMVICGDDSSVHMLCLKVCVFVCVMDADLPGYHKHTQPITVDKGEEIGYIYTHTYSHWAA